jgi:hypothetical protein
MLWGLATLDFFGSKGRLFVLLTDKQNLVHHQLNGYSLTDRSSDSML